MRKPNTSVEEQYRIVMAARQSGLSDSEWCRRHDVATSTFYNWVVRLRKRGCDISDYQIEFQLPSVTQDVVLLDVIPDELVAHHVCIETPPSTSSLVLEINGAKLSIPNGIDNMYKRVYNFYDTI